MRRQIELQGHMPSRLRKKASNRQKRVCKLLILGERNFHSDRLLKHVPHRSHSLEAAFQAQLFGAGLHGLDAEIDMVIEWDVEDPVYMKYEDHCQIRDRIETLVVKLVLDLRKADDEPRFRGQGSGRLEL